MGFPKSIQKRGGAQRVRGTRSAARDNPSRPYFSLRSEERKKDGEEEEPAVFALGSIVPGDNTRWKRRPPPLISTGWNRVAQQDQLVKNVSGASTLFFPSRFFLLTSN
ncbi:unnamed protein product [Bursaphelenchus xylophilus]|uniref:(pine wood nematode) hypothetical protein n=1 Tax=Bursaphelenchus xylophilus TaxID=6326 RepID=A0A1I7SV91_BURXY|nr:unnamed protein product [Bursaphelenchus xylophilus]CAG9101088.1 unnamed protein product [Bursaphelenchus xylophilus]